MKKPFLNIKIINWTNHFPFRQNDSKIIMYLQIYYSSEIEKNDKFVL